MMDDLAKLTPTGADFLRTIAHDDWWRTDEGARVPQSLVKSGMVERADGIGGKIYRITAAGILARAALTAAIGDEFSGWVEVVEEDRGR